MALNENVKNFMDLYEASPEIRMEYAEAEAMYPGSTEIRENVVEYVLIPFAREHGFEFTLDDLRKYETMLKYTSHPDVEINPDEPDVEIHYWLLEHGWTDDEAKFCGE